MTDEFSLFEKVGQEELFYKEKHSEVNAPYNKVPIRAMPEARQEPYDEDIEDVTRL